MRVVVVSDTHIRRGSARRLPGPALDQLERADLILHAGDVVDDEVLGLLAALAPVQAVLGNNDQALMGELPEVLEIDLGGVAVAMVHDSGPSKGRAARLHHRFPTADLVLFGHSHIPLDEVGVNGQRLINPGSPTERRAQPHQTLATLDLDDGQVARSEIIVVGP